MPKHEVKKEDLKYIYAVIDMELSGNYHKFYTDFGLTQGTNKNFHCPNAAAHSDGSDSKASVSIDNATGVGHCFACNYKFNAVKYWKDYVAKSPQDTSGDGSYTSAMIDYLNISNYSGKGTSTDDLVKQMEKVDVQDLYNKLQDKKVRETGKPYIMPERVRKEVKDEQVINPDVNKVLHERLINSDKDMRYLYNERCITEDVIIKYKLGMDEYGGFSFPMFDANGDLKNIKVYNPRNEKYKWKALFSGFKNLPTPIGNFTHQAIYMFEGEPDCYAALSLGVSTAVTLGPAGNCDVDKVFGKNMAQQLFHGKEVVVCMDMDESGERAAKSIAHSVYPYAQQVKIINLDKRHGFQYGLDPELKVLVDGKEKRKEKDFTDFVKKNGLKQNTYNIFMGLVKNTTVYTENVERKKKVVYKTSLQEARDPKYFSSEEHPVELELRALVADMDYNLYQFPSVFSASCPCMNDTDGETSRCKHCSIPTMPNYGHITSVELKFVREKTKETSRDNSYIVADEHNILGLIGVNEMCKRAQQKRMANINTNCPLVTLKDIRRDGMHTVRLVKDVNERGMSITKESAADVEMDAWVLNRDIYQNNVYKFRAVQTTSWEEQHSVLVIYDAEPIATTVEMFTMNQEIHDLLTIFKRKDGESIEENLGRRYKTLAAAAGINKRHEIFFACDLAYFSAKEIHFEMIKEIKRGYVEVLIAGDTKCAKTLIARFLQNRYKMGELVAGSDAISRSGLIGGARMFKNKHKIVWGAIPLNDGGLVIIDELSNVDKDLFEQLKTVRSDGVANLKLIVSGRAPASTRKIMLSNPREWHEENSSTSSMYGISVIKNLCLNDANISRFDFAEYVRQKDVDSREFSSSYPVRTTDFNEYQCQALIRWAYSRKPTDIIFEDGIGELATNHQVRLTDKYHSCTQLINIETRTKILRMAVSLATMLYSTPDDDWNKILVTKEHVDYIANYIDSRYSGPNMAMDKFSEQIKRSEHLGDMNFMMNILKYVDINQLLRFEDFNDRELLPIFADYFSRVVERRMYMPEALDGAKPVLTGSRQNDLLPKFIGVLLARNCIQKMPRGRYKKTEVFNNWLRERVKDGDNAEQSDILEPKFDQYDVEGLEKLAKRKPHSGNVPEK